jgi:hypothetical protein
MSSSNPETQKAPKGKGSRHRSPAYPAIALEEAIEKVGTLFQQDKRAYATPEAILSHLDYSSTGGKARRIVSAMRQYGLLDEEEGKYRVSDSAFKIINLSEASEERWGLIRAAATSPPIILRVIDAFGGELPSDATLKDYLITEEKFNPDSVDLFIRVLRETLAFAKIPSVGYTPNQGEESNTRMAASRQLAKTDFSKIFQSQRDEGIPPSQLPFPLYLSKTQKATLLVPSSMTRKEYDLLKKQIENSLTVMEATILSDDDPAPETSE